MSPEAIADMFALMETLNGVGLAAPQCSITDHKIAVVQFEGERYILNEPVLRQYEDWTLDTEGCLSLPGRTFWVVRHHKILIGTKAGRMHATGMLSRIWQHEMDHLNGVLISDIGIEEDYGMT